jgi:hypothetical protein
MVDDLGYLKRRDIPGSEWSNLIDGFGAIVATVKTEAISAYSKNGDVRRFRLKTERHDAE